MPQPRRAPGTLVPGLLVALALLVLTSSSHASSRLAVMDLRPQEGVTAAEARTLTGLLRTALHQTEAFALINREDLEEIARNYQIELTVCDDDACLLRLGTLVGAQLLVTGDVGKVFEEFVVNLRLVDLAGETLANRVITSEVTRGDARSFQASMTRAARTLAGLPGLEGETPGLPAREPEGTPESPGGLTRLAAQGDSASPEHVCGWCASTRVGVSILTGLLGLEVRASHLAVGVGYLYYYGHGVTGGIRYYLRPGASSWFVGLGAFYTSPQEDTQYERSVDLRNHAIGLHIGHGWSLGRSRDITAALGWINVEHMGHSGMLEIKNLGYPDVTLGFKF